MDSYENETPATQPQQPTPSYFYTSSQDQPWETPQSPTPKKHPFATDYTAQPQPASPTPPPKKSGKGWKMFGAFVVILALVISASALTAKRVNDHWKEQYDLLSKSIDQRLNVLQQQIQSTPNESAGNSVSGTPNQGTDGGLTPAQVYAQNVASVVAIECSSTSSQFGQSVTSISSGSGFVLTADGYIASNYHVVEGASSISVILSDGTQYDAQYIGGDSSNDIAVLKIESSELRPVTVGSSDALIVGDQVAAIGNPLGELASTLTVGYISAKERIVTTDGSQINMLQTDAAVNSGNSGGPLFNMKGEVIGITTAKYSGTTSSGTTIEGIGFAIPMDDVANMLEDLKQYGYVTGAFLGVKVSDVDESDASLYGLPMGALVHKVTAGSCADNGGIQTQDIIINLGGYDINNLNDLTRALRNFKAGDEITVTVHRASEGGEIILSVTLDEKPQSLTTGSPSTDTTDATSSADDWFSQFFG